jgi:hypothetical protein
MPEDDKDGIRNYLYETRWEIIHEDNRWLGKAKMSLVNDDHGYRIAMHSKGKWFRPKKYVVRLMPYEITYYDDPSDVIIPDEYEFGNDNVMYFEYFGNMVSYVDSNTDIAYIADDDDVKLREYDFGDTEMEQTLDTEKEADDLAVAIMETMENGKWDPSKPSLENLPPEYR